MSRHPRRHLWRSTTALTAALSLALPGLATAQAAPDMTVIPPGEEAAVDAPAADVTPAKKPRPAEAERDGETDGTAEAPHEQQNKAGESQEAPARERSTEAPAARDAVPEPAASSARPAGRAEEKAEGTADGGKAHESTAPRAAPGATRAKERSEGAASPAPAGKPAAAPEQPAATRPAAKAAGVAAEEGAEKEAAKPEAAPAQKPASDAGGNAARAPGAKPAAEAGDTPAPRAATRPNDAAPAAAAGDAKRSPANARPPEGEGAAAAADGKAGDVVPDAAGLAAALAEKEKGEEGAAKPAAAPAPTSAAPAPADTADGAKKAAPDAAGLAAALAEKEKAAGETGTEAAASEGAAKADEAAAGTTKAPQPVEIDESSREALSKALGDAAAQDKADADAPAAAQGEGAPEKAAQDKNAQDKSAQDETAKNGNGENGDSEDAAAREAASGEAPAAAALSAPAELSGDATEVAITDDSARKSSEDFATSIAAAAAAAQGGQEEGANRLPGSAPETGQEAGDGGKKKDDSLRSVLIGGLAGLAVGSVLGNQNKVALNSGDRVVVVAPDGSRQILKDDDALLLRPGAKVTNETFDDGSSRSIVTRDDGSRVVTIRDAQLRVLRRTLIRSDGSAVELIDDATRAAPVVIGELPPAARPLEVSPTASSAAQLRAALEQEAAVDRRFSLSQIRDISQVRNLVAPISIDSITFDTGSAAIRPDQAQQLAALGETIAAMIAANPREMFLVEGYTDTVGSADMNLALSDRRAESLALALTEYFHVPPENMVVQGYGERFLKVAQEGDVRANRRVAVRRITDLLQQ